MFEEVGGWKGCSKQSQNMIESGKCDNEPYFENSYFVTVSCVGVC